MHANQEFDLETFCTPQWIQPYSTNKQWFQTSVHQISQRIVWLCCIMCQKLKTFPIIAFKSSSPVKLSTTILLCFEELYITSAKLQHFHMKGVFFLRVLLLGIENRVMNILIFCISVIAQSPVTFSSYMMPLYSKASLHAFWLFTDS